MLFTALKGGGLGVFEVNLKTFHDNFKVCIIFC